MSFMLFMSFLLRLLESLLEYGVVSSPALAFLGCS